MSGWQLLLDALTVGLLALFFTLKTRRYRQRIFLSACGLAAAVAVYGWVFFWLGNGARL